MLVKKYSRFQNKNHHNFCMFPASYSEGFAPYGKILHHISKHPKIVMIFFFEIWNIFWQIFQNFFGKIYGYFGLTARWLYRRKYLHIPQAHSKLSMGHILGTFVQFFNKVCHMCANHAKCAAWMRIMQSVPHVCTSRKGLFKNDVIACGGGV